MYVLRALIITLAIALLTLGAGIERSVAEEDVSAQSYKELLDRLQAVEKELRSLKKAQSTTQNQVTKQGATVASQQVKVESIEEATARNENYYIDQSAAPTLGNAPGAYTGFTPPPSPADRTARGLHASAELLLLRPFSSRNTAMAIQDTNILNTPETSKSRDFQNDIGAGGRYVAGFMPQQGLGWSARYWHFKQKQTANSVGTEDVEVNFFDDPDIAIDDNGHGILAERELELRAGDLAVDYVNPISGGGTARFIAGVRAVDFEGNGKWTDQVLTGERAVAKIDWTGAGPMIGVHGTVPLFETSRVSVNGFAGASAALLFGDGDLFVGSDRDASAFPRFDDLVEISRDGTPVYSTDIQIGLETIIKPNPDSPWELFVNGSAEAQYWQNIGIVTANVAAGKDSDDGENMLDGNLGLIGGAVGIGARRKY